MKSCLFIYIPGINFSHVGTISPVFLGFTSIKQQIKCLAQGHNTVTPLAVTLKLANLFIPSLML